jgi:hypothetical protein
LLSIRNSSQRRQLSTKATGWVEFRKILCSAPTRGSFRRSVPTGGRRSE